MSKFVQRFVSDESGATAIEYGLIVALIAVVIITAVQTLGTKLNSKIGPCRASGRVFLCPQWPKAGVGSHKCEAVIGAIML